MELEVFLFGLVIGGFAGGFTTIVWAQWILNQRDKL